MLEKTNNDYYCEFTKKSFYVVNQSNNYDNYTSTSLAIYNYIEHDIKKTMQNNLITVNKFSSPDSAENLERMYDDNSSNLNNLLSSQQQSQCCKCCVIS
jgi:hypothetical protein